MSDNIHIRANGEAVFASTKREWHTLGRDTKGKAMTVADGLRLTGLDRLRFEAGELTTTVLSGSGVGTVTMPNHKAVLLRDLDTDTATPVGVVGVHRALFQPEELLAPLDVIADAAGGSIETVGMLGAGGVWFASVKFPQGWTILGDVFDGYIMGRDSADGSSALDLRATFVRPVCQNTFNQALRETRGSGSVYSLRHTRNAKVNVAEARAKIGMVPAYAKELEEAAKALYAKAMTEKRYLGVTEELFGAKPTGKAATARALSLWENRQMELIGLLRADTQASTLRNGKPTGWTAYNAIVEYLDWVQPVRGGDEQDRRTARMVMRTTAPVKTQALALLS